MSIIEFYRDKHAVWVDANTRMTVEDMHTCMDFSMLESSHSFIQWIFPTDERSRFNPDAPLLAQDEARSIASNLYTALRVRESFVMIIRFFGFEMNDDGDVVAADTHRLLHLVENRHNWMRISRILRSLLMLGFTQYAHSFFQALSFQVDHGCLAECRMSCEKFWRPCVCKERPRGFPETTCLEAFCTIDAKRQIGHLCIIIRATRCLGAQRALQKHVAGECVVVGVKSPKKICVLTPWRMRLVVLNGLCRRIIVLEEDGPHDARLRTALFAFDVYKAIHRSNAHFGVNPLCRIINHKTWRTRNTLKLRLYPPDGNATSSKEIIVRLLE